MTRIIAALLLLVSCLRLAAGDYLVVFRQHVSENATPSVMECDSLEVFPGYSKLRTSGKPTFEVKKGALIAIVAKKDFQKLEGYSNEYPALKNTFDEVKSRWQSEVGADAQKKADAERAFSESLANGSRVKTLDGRSFQGIVKASGQYALSLTTPEGISTVGIAQLGTEDLNRWNTVARDHDGRFWYERTLAIIKARESGADLSAESKEAEAHFLESSSYLAQMDQAREQRRKMLVAESSSPNKKTPEQGNPLRTQEDIDELLRMSKLGYVPVLDESTGRIFYSAPVETEEQLREVMQGQLIQGE
ncbi:MAG: hypothetical protein WCH98_19430 [Verrucomicrobiota bacterium]